MRKGFKLNFTRQDFFLVNNNKMYVTLEGSSCLLRFDERDYVIGDGGYLKINEDIELCFNKAIGKGRKGDITFYCSRNIQVFRSNHPGIRPSTVSP